MLHLDVMSKTEKEVYISTDIETDGPIPGPHSMLSFGSVALDEHGNSLGEFEANLHLLEGASPHPKTEEFWKQNPVAFAATRTNLQSPKEAMKKYVQWIKSLPGKPVFVAYPAGFDWNFFYWYLIRFTDDSPFSFSALDMKSFTMAVLGLGYRESTKRNMPKSWFDRSLSHTHVALDDAKEQGYTFLQMLRFSKAMVKKLKEVA